jgi:hypothetical protein
MLISLPLYEINSWGGYTTILSLAFMCLLFVYLPTLTRSIQPVFITFLTGFSLVLSQQLATFVAVFILPPFFVVLLITSRGKHAKAWIAAFLGGGIAFFLYYVQPILARFNMVVYHVFFQIQSMAYQIPLVSFDSFLLGFGFILFFAAFGMLLSFNRLRRQKKLSYFLILFLSLVIPLFFSQSYLFGLYLPYEMFIYFLLPAMAVFGAVTLGYVADLSLASYRKIKVGRKTLWKIATAAIIIIMAAVLLFRFQTVGDRINQGANYYSTSDLKAYDAAVWLKQNFPTTAGTVVVTEKPGSWFGMYSGKTVIAETDPVFDRNVVAESVLDLSYEIEHPLTMVRTLEARSNTFDEAYVSVNSVWKRVSFLSEQWVFVSYNQNNVAYRFNLSGLNRNIVFDETGAAKQLTIKYSNDEILLTENILVQDDRYPIDVVWDLSPLKNEIDNASLYITNYLDASFSFDKAYVPGLLNWQSPWDKPTYVGGNNNFALLDFSSENMTGNYIGAYDDQNQVAFALRFVDLPDSGNVGALANRMVDAIRFQYQYGNVTANQTVSSTYQLLTFSKTSYPEMPPLNDLGSMFDLKPASTFTVTTRDYADYIKQQNIEFIVYDKTRFDNTLLRTNLLQLVYSNDEFVICKIKTAPTA